MRVALLTIDVQNDFATQGGSAYVSGTAEVLPNIVQLVKAFRESQRPIVHIVRLYRRDGSNAELCRRELIRSGKRIVAPHSRGAELVAELKSSRAVRLAAPFLLRGRVQQVGDHEFILYKPRWGAFYCTPLEKWLRSWDIDTLVVSGCNYPNCPRATLYEASERDFHTVMVLDAVSGVYTRGIRELQRIGVRVMTARQVLRLVR